MQLQKVANKTYEFIIHDDITKEDIQKISDAFQEFDERKEKVNLLGVFKSFPSMDGMQSVSEILKMKFKSFGVINKYAILADKDWIENLVPVANFLTPSLSVKAFDEDERQKAIDWLCREEVKQYKPEEYLTGVDIQKIAEKSYTINLDNNQVDHASMVVLNTILSNLNPGEKINLLVHFKEFPSIENFKTFVEGLKVDFKIFGRIRKYAIVSDMKWITTYSKIGDFLTPNIDVKAFADTEMEKAQKWILS